MSQKQQRPPTSVSETLAILLVGFTLFFIPYALLKTLNHLERKDFLLKDTKLQIACMENGGKWNAEGQECLNSERRVRINPPLN